MYIVKELKTMIPRTHQHAFFISDMCFY